MGEGLTRDPYCVSSRCILTVYPSPETLLNTPTRDPYSKSSLCILHTRPLPQALHTRPLLQVLNPSPQSKSSIQVLNPSPQSKSSLCILHTRPLLQALHTRPLLQVLHYSILIEYISIQKSVINSEIGTVYTRDLIEYHTRDPYSKSI